jgi:hypothetical protein
MNEFERGDMVSLKGIEAPTMLVISSTEHDAQCIWFDKNNVLCDSHFGNDILVDAEHV